MRLPIKAGLRACRAQAVSQESGAFRKYGYLKNTSSKDDFYSESDERGVKNF